jgi:hypothetical protein
MRETTNKQEPSSTEGGKMKAGDKVWVRAIIEGFVVGGVRVQGLCGGVFWTVAKDLRPDAAMPNGNELVSKHNKGIEVQGE